MSEKSGTPEWLTADQVAERLDVSRRTLFRYVKAGKVPQPVRWSRKNVKWRAAEIERFVAAL